MSLSLQTRLGPLGTRLGPLGGSAGTVQPPSTAAILVEDFNNTGQWTSGQSAGSVSAAADTVNFLHGTQGMSVINQTAGGSVGWIEKTYTTLAFNADDVMSFAFFNSKTGAYLNAVTVELTGTGGVVGIKSTNYTGPGMAGVWQRVTLNRSEFTNASSLTGNITKVRMRVNFNASSTVSDYATFTDIYMRAKGRPSLMIAFDNGYSNNYTYCFPLMQANNDLGSVFLTSSFVGTGSGSATYSLLSQLQAMDAAGWDISNHTASDLAMSGYTPAQVQTEWNTCANYITGNGMSARGVRYGSYPLGSVSANVLTGGGLAGMKIVRGSFGLPGDYNMKIPVPYGLPTPLLIPGVSYNSPTSIATATAYIDSLILRGTGGIIWSHDVSAAPSIGQTEVNWSGMYNYAVTQKQAGLIDILTMSQFGARVGI